MKKSRDDDSRSINLVLLAASFIIFGVFGMIFLTQMDLQSGWAPEDIRDIYPNGYKNSKNEPLGENY
jgi:hypothetical protein